MRVLFAVDGSAGSFEAIRQVAPRLAAERDEVVLFCKPPNVRVRSVQLAPKVVEAAHDSLAQAVFDEARKRLPPPLAAKARAVVGQQDPRQGIVLAAKQARADLIVVGARGLGTFERLILGSVSRAVVHAAEVPVWVVRRPKHAPAHDEPRVLLACESAATARRPAALVSQLRWPDRTSFTMLTVVPSLFAGRVPEWLQEQAREPGVDEAVQAWVREHDETMQHNVSELKGFLAELPPPLAGGRAVVLEGEPAHLILSAAAQDQADLVVVGTTGKWFPGAGILGSTSEAVVNHADCSVLIVPHPEQP